MKKQKSLRNKNEQKEPMVNSTNCRIIALITSIYMFYKTEKRNMHRL